MATFFTLGQFIEFSPLFPLARLIPLAVMLYLDNITYPAALEVCPLLEFHTNI